MSDDNQRPQTKPIEKGEIRTVQFGTKIVAVKDLCTCGGHVHVKSDPETGGKIAVCTKCGATLKYKS